MGPPPLPASLGVQGRQAQHSPRGEAVASRPAATLALPAGRKQILQAAMNPEHILAISRIVVTLCSLCIIIVILRRAQ